jgi:hypothetical protein
VGRSSSLKGLNVRLKMGVAPNPVPTRADIVSAIQRIRTLNSKEIINRSSCIALLGWHEPIGQCHLPMVSGGGYIGKEARRARAMDMGSSPKLHHCAVPY